MNIGYNIMKIQYTTGCPFFVSDVPALHSIKIGHILQDTQYITNQNDANTLDRQHIIIPKPGPTVCPRSLAHLYILCMILKLDKTSWSFSRTCWYEELNLL